MYTYDVNLLSFILWNILTIILVGVVYFVIKEIYRIRGGQLGKVGIGFVGSIIGISILLIQLFLGAEVFLSNPNPELNHYLIYNGVILSPTIIIIIVFVTMVDSRLVVPLFIFQLVALVWKLPIGVEGVDSTVVWSKILFTVVEYAILILILYYIPTINFIKKNGVKLIISFIMYFITSITITVVFHASIPSWGVSMTELTSMQFIAFAYLSIFAILQTTLVFFVDKIYSNFSALETFSTKDDISYYKMSLAQNSLLKMIDEKKVNTGLLTLFQIKTSSQSDESEILRKLRENTETKYENTFYFKASAKYYGAFFQLSDNFNLELALQNNKNLLRSEDDELYPLTKEISRIAHEEEATIIAAGSIYGVHSYSVPELIEHSRFLMSPIVSRANTNPLIIYDFKRVKERLTETAHVRELPVGIENMNITFLRALSSKEIFYPTITFKDDENTLVDIISEGGLTQEQLSTLLRFTSYQTIRKFDKKKGNLIIFYPSYHLNSESFKFRDFVKKIDRHFETSRLILGIDTSIGEFGEVFKSNLKEIRKAGIKIAAVNPKTITQEEHDYLEPDYILDPDTDNNPLKIKKIQIKIQTDSILLNPNLII